MELFDETISRTSSLGSLSEISKIDQMRVFVSQRLTAAAEEIFGAFEIIIKDYEAEDIRSKREIERQSRLLGVFLNHKTMQEKTEAKALSACRMEAPPGQQKSLSRCDEGTDPPLIKEEDLSGQEEGDFQGVEEADSKDSSVFTTVTSVGNLCNKYESPPLSLHPSVDNAEGECLPSTSVQHVEVEADRMSQPISDSLAFASGSSGAESDYADGEDWIPESRGDSLGLNTSESQTLTSDSKVPVSCKVCDRPFTCFGWFVRHVRTHAKDSPCICGMCGKHLESGTLINHLKTHKGATLDILSMPHKSQTLERQSSGFVSNSVTDREVTESSQQIPVAQDNTQSDAQSDDKGFYCTDCGRRFKNRFNLIQHMRIHTGEKPHSCNVCGREFNHRGNLRVHMRIHTGEKPHICNVCGKHFRHGSGLAKHVRIHRAKPYSCSFCGMSFRLKSNLTTHMSVHTGKPYSCSICGQGFDQVVHLKHHMMYDHAVYPK